jgi:uncharacterized SAM-binding protein YcdF (DUF218 family)
MIFMLWWLPHAGTLLVRDVPLEAPDAIVSLASHEWERLPQTITLAHRYPRSRIILTEPRNITQFNCHDCLQRLSWLVQNGIARDRITVVPLTESGTFGEAVAVAQLIRGIPLRRILIVTSPYHTRRAFAVFRSVLASTPAQVGIAIASQSPAQPGRWWTTPYDRWYVRYEWAAIAYYAFRYGVWS